MLAVIAMVAGGAYVIRSVAGDEEDSSATGCGGPTVTVEAAPEIADVVQGAMSGCDNVEVIGVPSAETAQKVSAGKGAPDVWIPDSSAWEARIAELAPVPPKRLLTSVASSPIVIASKVGNPPSTWSDLLKDPNLIMGDPLTSTAAVVPLVGTGAESGLEKSSQLIVPLAQEQSEGSGKLPTDSTRVKDVESGEQGLTTVSEQAVLTRAPGLTMTVPATGTTYLDYPVLLTTSEDRRADIEATTEALTKRLKSSEMKEALAEAKFRSTSGELIENGVKDITRLALPNADDLNSLLRSWGTFARPSWILAVIDVSGSMDYQSGSSTRIELLASTVEGGLSLFPDAAGIGVWVFSEKLQGTADYRELLPTRRLDAKVGSGTHREAILAEARKLPSMTSGGTGLYDTVLAAYRTAQASWNPRAVNSVIIFTDGENDDPGSISKEELLSELRRLSDPARPISINAFGLTKDSDIEALKEIATTTGGGNAYEVLDPAQMGEYFALALSGRDS
ncbi:substrate-binding and VWA domain-containing protein [Nocardioides speluncae]|uniref:substrate-binding and VWA domain-containing protein n=1 Tax=Nocardioides speluncae TaxID=2670337 RepID=UPI000D695A04|nr:substrate-binding and VWA domain-containing protein [Nocardioides speluncae]